MPVQKDPDSQPQDNTSALRLILPILFIVLIVTVAYLLYPMFAKNVGPQIILNIIKLRTESQTLSRSQLITETDDMVKSTKDRSLMGEWSTLTQCLPQGCPDDDYLNFIGLVTQQMDIPNRDLIQNIIITYRYWGTDEIVRFSKAMTAVTRSIEDTYSRSLEEKWKGIIECDGKCAEKNDLYFQAIEIAVEL